jgi:hypothetical protein
MSYNIKPFYRSQISSGSSTPYTINLSDDGNSLHIARYGNTGKDFFRYDVTIGLDKIQKHVRYTVVGTDNMTMFANFDEDGNVYDNSFVNNYFHSTMCRPNEEVVLWRTDADEYYILSRYTPTSNMQFTHNSTNFSKIVKATSVLGDTAFNKYMEVADKLDRRMWMRDSIHPEDKLDYMDIQLDVTTKILKAILDQNPSIKESLPVNLQTEIAIMEASVDDQSNYALPALDHLSSTELLSKFTVDKTNVRSIQEIYGNNVYPYYDGAYNPQWDDPKWDNPNKIIM